jgi:class 3 adenylate cyclase/tetratricopeptide (TPR) repeat protein
MGDVDRWLNTLGLDCYSRIFSEHEIDSDALRELTDSDLRELGIPVGHRKRILKGIRQLEEDKIPSGHDETRSGRKGDVATWNRDAERRHLTILFVDIVESTSFAQRLDPEDLANLLNAFHETCRQVVDRFGGYVGKNLGDGLGAYFGWPESREHDAERAVLTGLELIEAVKAIPTGTPDRIQIHVGIATGEVVVGDVLRMDSARVNEVFGELPNLAARLQATSPPDTVLISAETHQLIHHKFVCVDVGRKKLKGFHELTPVHQVIGPRAFSLNFDARSAIGLTPLIGRTAEVELLKTRWQSAAAGDGHVVLLAGEPGIGKSRLCAELRSSLNEQKFSGFSFQCSPLHTDSPFYPVTRFIAQIADLSDDDSLEVKWQKLEALFDDIGDDRLEGISLLATHLGIPVTTSSRQGLMSPEHQRMTLHRLLTNFVFMLARRRPVLFTFEDVHWMDPTTSEFLDTLISRIREHAVLLILTFRPTFTSPWHESERQTLLTLDRLTRDQSEQFIKVFASTARLSRDVIAELIERSDGNPLYIEELTAAVLGGRQTEKADTSSDSGVRTRSNIPSTLQESLLSRIDRTSPQARELIQVCAVVGRRFSYEQISAIADINGRKLDETLAELVHYGLLHSIGRPPDTEYSFKHALIQDAAYSIILRDKRQRLHARCALALEAHFASICVRDPGVLGLHHEIGDDRKAAVPYFLAAGQLAIERFALREANTYLQKGLALLETLPESELRDKQELRFRSMLGRVCIFAKGWAHRSVKKEYGRALELAKSVGMEKEQVPLEWALTTYHLLRGEIREAVTGGHRVLELAEHVKDQDLLHVAHSALTIYQFYSGNFVDAVNHKDQALRFYRAQASAELQKHFGTDRRLQALRGAALSHWCLGNHRIAIDLDEEQRSLAMNSDRPFEYAYALTISCILHSLRRDAQMTYSCAEVAIKIAQDQGFSFLEANAENFRAVALALQHPLDRTLRGCDEAIGRYQAAGNRMGISSMLAIMAELCGRMGAPDRGLLYVDRALGYVRRSGERFAKSDLYRVKGELLAAVNRIDEAKHCLSRALLLAQKQHAKTWELEAAIPLAHILFSQSKFEESYGLLEPLCHKFQSSGFVSDQMARAHAICAQCSTGERPGTHAAARP